MSPDPNGRKLGKLAAMKPAVLSEDWRIPVLFSLIPVGSVVYAAAHAWFWQRAHDTVWAAAPLLLVLTAQLLRRSRLVWWFWVIASGAGVLTWVVDLSTHTVTTRLAVGGFIGLLEFGLLLSPPMRRFVRLRGRLAPSPS
jgi:hypothetical protein